ncbi:ABC transporter ATP-binding protein [uncultured Methanomethylovorans sp.]|uniref:ABC transporter ATP-binding protein n=1 Tax=uncultured Methanomethylovorans sp. TaxID=183759 RepID=UPI002AA8384B|nr:ABC transporter ATP-binding protein [uncultured Methanomethylovorans sp.]
MTDTRLLRSDGISINNIYLSYKKELVFNGLNLSVKKGSIVTMVGPNGCGKTTLLKIINGSLKQHHGTVFIDGKNSETIPNMEMAKTLSYVPQLHRSSFPFSVLDVVLTGRMPYISIFSTPGKQDIEKACCILEFLEISHFAHRPYTQISGGERQMVMIAKALVQEPDFLLLDEPTSFLDLKNQIHVLKTITTLSKTRNITVLMTLHEPNHAMLFSDEVILLRKLEAVKNEKIPVRVDNIVVSGTPEKVMTPAKIFEAYGIHVDIVEHNGKKVIVPVV